MLNSKLNKKMILSVVLAAGIGMSSIAGAVSSDSRSAAVSYSDLDLSNVTGQETLYKRLRTASEGVCGPTSISKNRSLSAAANARKCFKSSLNEAVQSINHEALKALHKTS
jgi:UrcA family protein